MVYPPLLAEYQQGMTASFRYSAICMVASTAVMTFLSVAT